VNQLNEKKIKIIHRIMLVLGIIFFASGAFHSGLWFDESYTVGLMNQNFIDLCKAATYDVHPLGYYIILRLFAYVFGNSIISLRLFSVLGAALLASLGYTHIRRDFGAKTGIWFSFFVITMPSTFKYALQIRMYTWAPLFVTLAAIYSYRMILKDGNITKITNNKNIINNTKNAIYTKNTVLFAIFSILSAYMHYYGLMAVVIINIMILVYYIKNNLKLKKWYILGAIQMLGYLPGLYVFFVQFTLSNGSWIKINFGTIFDAISFHFIGSPQSDIIVNSPSYIIPLCIGFIIYAMFGFLFIRMIKNNKEESKPVTLALIVYFGVVLMFLLVSIFKPIFYVRYLIVSYGMLLFAFAYLLAKCNKIYVKILVIVVMLGLSVTRAIPIYQDNYDASNTIIDDYLKANLKEGDIILFDSPGAFSVSVKFQDVPTYFYNAGNWNIQKAYKAFGSKVTILSNLDIIKNHTGRIWIIDDGNTYKTVMSWGGTTELSYEKMQMKYYASEHEIILIDKK